MTGLTPKAKLGLVIIIGFLHALFWFNFFPHATLADKEHYHTIAVNIIDGRGFSMDEELPYLPTIYRVPVYPFFLAGIYTVFGRDNADAVYLIQALLFTLIVLLVFHIALLVSGSENVAFLASLLTSLHPGVASFTCEIMTELLYTFLLLLFIYLFIRALKSARLTDFLLSGLCLGVAALCRPIAKYIPVLIVVYFIFAVKVGFQAQLLGARRKKYLVAFLLTFLGMSMTVFPWCFRNLYHFNKFALSLEIGEVLIQHVALLDKSKMHNATLLASFSESVAKKYYPQYSRKSFFRVVEKTMLTELDNHWLAEVPASRQHSGINYVSLDSLWMKASLRMIRAHPFRYLQRIIFSPIDSHTNIFIPQIAHISNIIPQYRKILFLTKLAMLATIILGFFSLKLNYTNARFLFLVFIAAYTALAISPIIHGARYMISNYPLYLIMIGMFLVHIFGRNKKKKGPELT